MVRTVGKVTIVACRAGVTEEGAVLVERGQYLSEEPQITGAWRSLNGFYERGFVAHTRIVDPGGIRFRSISC